MYFWLLQLLLISTTCWFTLHYFSPSPLPPKHSASQMAFYRQLFLCKCGYLTFHSAEDQRCHEGSVLSSAVMFLLPFKVNCMFPCHWLNRCSEGVYMQPFLFLPVCWGQIAFIKTHYNSCFEIFIIWKFRSCWGVTELKHTGTKIVN